MFEGFSEFSVRCSWGLGQGALFPPCLRGVYDGNSNFSYAGWRCPNQSNVTHWRQQSRHTDIGHKKHGFIRLGRTSWHPGLVCFHMASRYHPTRINGAVVPWSPWSQEDHDQPRHDFRVMEVNDRFQFCDWTENTVFSQGFMMRSIEIFMGISCDILIYIIYIYVNIIYCTFQTISKLCVCVSDFSF